MQTNTISTDHVAEIVANYPGSPREVWGGWVWVTGSTEHRWSKRRTRAECESVVYETVERLGLEEAFSE